MHRGPERDCGILPSSATVLWDTLGLLKILSHPKSTSNHHRTSAQEAPRALSEIENKQIRCSQRSGCRPGVLEELLRGSDKQRVKDAGQRGQEGRKGGKGKGPKGLKGHLNLRSRSTHLAGCISVHQAGRVCRRYAAALRTLDCILYWCQASRFSSRPWRRKRRTGKQSLAGQSSAVFGFAEAMPTISSHTPTDPMMLPRTAAPRSS